MQIIKNGGQHFREGKHAQKLHPSRAFNAWETLGHALKARGFPCGIN